MAPPRVYVSRKDTKLKYVSRKDIVMKCLFRARGIIVLGGRDQKEAFTDFVMLHRAAWLLRPEWWRRRKQVVFARSDVRGVLVWNTNPWPSLVPRGLTFNFPWPRWFLS